MTKKGWIVMMKTKSLGNIDDNLVYFCYALAGCILDVDYIDDRCIFLVARSGAASRAAWSSDPIPRPHNNMVGRPFVHIVSYLDSSASSVVFSKQKVISLCTLERQV